MRGRIAVAAFAAVLGVLSLSAVSAQNNDIPVELGQKEKQIAELLEETVVAKSVEDDDNENELVVVNPLVTEVLEEPVQVGIDAIPVVKSVEVLDIEPEEVVSVSVQSSQSSSQRVVPIRQRFGLIGDRPRPRLVVNRNNLSRPGAASDAAGAASPTTTSTRRPIINRSRFRRPQSRPRVTAAAPEVDSVESNEIAEAAAAAPAPSTTTQRTRLFSPQRRTRFRPKSRPVVAVNAAAAAPASDSTDTTTTTTEATTQKAANRGRTRFNFNRSRPTFLRASSRATTTTTTTTTTTLRVRQTTTTSTTTTTAAQTTTAASPATTTTAQITTLEAESNGQFSPLSFVDLNDPTTIISEAVEEEVVDVPVTPSPISLIPVRRIIPTSQQQRPRPQSFTTRRRPAAGNAITPTELTPVTSAVSPRGPAVSQRARPAAQAQDPRKTGRAPVPAPRAQVRSRVRVANRARGRRPIEGNAVVEVEEQPPAAATQEVPRSGQGASLVARRRQRPNTTGTRRRIVPVVATEAPPPTSAPAPVRPLPVPAPLRPLPLPFPIPTQPGLVPAAEVTTQAQEVITAAPAPPAPTVAPAPVIQEVQEVVVETAPTAAAAPILETRLATSKLIGNSDKAFTTTVKSTAQAPPPPAPSSTFSILPDSFTPGTFSGFRFSSPFTPIQSSAAAPRDSIPTLRPATTSPFVPISIPNIPTRTTNGGSTFFELAQTFGSAARARQRIPAPAPAQPAPAARAPASRAPVTAPRAPVVASRAPVPAPRAPVPAPRAQFLPAPAPRQQAQAQRGGFFTFGSSLPSVSEKLTEPEPLVLQPQSTNTVRNRPATPARSNVLDLPRKFEATVPERKLRPRDRIRVEDSYRVRHDDGSYTWGYKSGDGSFKEETIGADCITRGRYGYVDPFGEIQEFNYKSGVSCDPTVVAAAATARAEAAVRAPSAPAPTTRAAKAGYYDYNSKRFVLPDGRKVTLVVNKANRARG